MPLPESSLHNHYTEWSVGLLKGVLIIFISEKQRSGTRQMRITENNTSYSSNSWSIHPFNRSYLKYCRNILNCSNWIFEYIIKLVGYLAAYRTVRSNQPWHCTHCTYSFRLSFGKLVPLLRKLSWDVLIFIGSGFVTKFSLLCMSSLVTLYCLVVVLLFFWSPSVFEARLRFHMINFLASVFLSHDYERHILHWVNHAAAVF